jgi:methionyl aminopeptidase
MNDEAHEKYMQAGKIASAAREYGAELIKSDYSYLDLAEKIESKIIDSGAGIAFPVNISINEVAAHFSPKHDDKHLFFKKGDIVKLDIGAHIDGFIADTAVTVEVGTKNHSDMIKASSNALDEAVDLMKPGISLNNIGEKVKQTINSYGYKPIENLTGHSMQRYVLHAGASVPNVPDTVHNYRPREGDVFAIEPFATNGAGYVIAGPGSNIYLCKKTFNPRLIRDKKTRFVHSQAKKEFNTLPFAQRWFERKFSNSEQLLRKLLFHNLIKQYPQLMDAKKGIVTQKEHTVIITENGCEVIT